METKFAPYLKINGKPVELGCMYWTVDKKTLNIKGCNAGNENNVSGVEYFLNFIEAENYVEEHKLQFSKEDLRNMYEVIKRFDPAGFDDVYNQIFYFKDIVVGEEKKMELNKRFGIVKVNRI